MHPLDSEWLYGCNQQPLLLIQYAQTAEKPLDKQWCHRYTTAVVHRDSKNLQRHPNRSDILEMYVCSHRLLMCRFSSALTAPSWMVIHAVSGLFTIWADSFLWSCYDVKSGQISRLHLHEFKYNINTVFHRHENILPHLWDSMTINNILCPKFKHCSLISLVGSESSQFFTACHINSSTAKRGRSAPLGNFSFSICCPWLQTWCIYPEQAKQFSPHHKDVSVEAVTATYI